MYGCRPHALPSRATRPQQAISEIVRGSKRITAEAALDLAAALGSSTEVWLLLDAGHQFRLAEERPEMAAARRAIRRRSQARAGGPPQRGRGRGAGQARSSYR